MESYSNSSTPTPEEPIRMSWSRWSTVRLERCFILMWFWQLKQCSVSAFPTMTQRHATINRCISLNHTSNNMCELISIIQLITIAIVIVRRDRTIELRKVVTLTTRPSGRGVEHLFQLALSRHMRLCGAPPLS